MGKQPFRQSKQQRTAYYFAGTLIGAALLTALGFMQQGAMTAPVYPRVKLVMVCVSGFSWDRVIPLHRGGRLPFLSQLFRGKGSCGDIVSSNDATDAAIIATLFTGRLPEKHKMRREDDFRQFLVPNGYQTPLWQELIARGQQCAVVGLPFSQNGESSGTRAAGRADMPASGVNGTQEYIERITAGSTVPGDLSALLQECISSDLNRMQQALSATGVRSDVHLFAFFQGLGRWQHSLLSKAGALPDGARNALIDNYYVFFDSILGRLFSQCGKNGIFILCSERGNLQGRPAYWSDAPRRVHYPAIGFFYATGLYIREGIEPLLLDAADVASTLLYLTGNPLVNAMDGRVNFRLLEEHYYFKRKIIATTQLLIHK